MDTKVLGEKKAGMAQKLPILLLGTGLLLVLFLLIRLLFRFPLFRESPFDTSIRFGLLGCGVALLHGINALPTFFEGLLPTQNAMVYIFDKSLNLLVQVLMMGGTTAIAVFLFTRCVPKVFPGAPGEGDFQRLLQRFPWKWRGSSQGILWALAILSFQYAFRTISLGYQGSSFFPIEYPYRGLEGFFPPLEILSRAWVHWVLWMTLGLMMASLKDLLPKHFSKIWLPASAFLFFYLLLDWSAETSLFILEIAFLLAFVLRFIRFHLPFFFWFSLLHLSIPYLLCLNSSDPSILWSGLYVLLPLGALMGRTWWQTIRYHLRQT